MTEKDIAHHMMMKKQFSNYPSLPMFMINNYKLGDGLEESCIRGFLKRVKNWKEPVVVKPRLEIKSETEI